MNFQVQVSDEPVEIFLIEDNPSDIFLLREALRQSHSQIHLEVAYGGEEALAHLRKEGAHASAREPNLVLLDLNLPKKTGWEILAELKEDFRLKHIPVLIWSSASDPSNIRLAYRLNANGYIVKPMDMEHYRVLASYLQDFWIDHFHVDGKRYLA
ncbi:MAG TPA: response regulator [bacterium]|nr:response regulator [bacterium]